LNSDETTSDQRTICREEKKPVTKCPEGFELGAEGGGKIDNGGTQQYRNNNYQEKLMEQEKIKQQLKRSY
jgi:hypothetical protein